MARLERAAQVQIRELGQDERSMTEHSARWRDVNKRAEEGRSHPLPCLDTTCEWHHEQ